MISNYSTLKNIAHFAIYSLILLPKILSPTPANNLINNPEEEIRHSIGYFQLIDLDKSTIKTSDLLNSKVAVIFILSPKCPPCDPNIYFFNKIARLRDGNCPAFGVILADESDLRKFQKIKKTRFGVFRPVDPESFKRAFGITHRLSQIILARNGKIIYRKIGELNSKDYFKIKKLLKGGVK